MNPVASTSCSVTDKKEIYTFDYLEPMLPTEKKLRSISDCRMYTRQRRRETSDCCAVCEENEAFCVEECFKEYHS